MDIEEYLSRYKEAGLRKDQLKGDLARVERQLGVVLQASFSLSRIRLKRDFLRDKRNLEIRIGYCEGDSGEILSDYCDQLVIVPGDEARFEQMARYPVEVVDLGFLNKGIVLAEKRGFRFFDRFQESEHRTPPELLLKNRVVGMIGAQIAQSDWSSRWDRGTERLFYGLPVRKKEK
jgi:hypothetical protein